MKMEHCEEEMVSYFYEDKYDDVINEEEVDFHECGNQSEIVNLWKY